MGAQTMVFAVTRRRDGSPTTYLIGATAGAVAGLAAALLAIGVVLFAVARRRRVKFTA
jgi:hypothetical protein